MAFPTPEEEGVVTSPEQPTVPEAAPVAPETQPVESVSEAPAPVPEPMPAVPPSGDSDSAIPEELVPQVQELVNVAFQDGVEAAVQKARKTGNEALVDALHDALAEPDKHEELVRLKKVSGV